MQNIYHSSQAVFNKLENRRFLEKRELKKCFFK